jgi:hypothetical protein
MIPGDPLDSRYIHLSSITRWNRGIVVYWWVFDLGVQALVISRRDKGIISGCFRTPCEFPGVPEGINNGGADPPSPRLRRADGTRTLKGKKRCASSRFLLVALGAFMPSPLQGSRLRHLLSRDQGHARARCEWHVYVVPVKVRSDALTGGS